MNFKLATLILSTLAAVGSSSPVAAPEDKNSTAPGTFHKLVSGGPAGKAASPQADQPLTHLYVCTDANFKGRCENLASTKQGCYTLFNGLDNVVSSLGPDAGTTCVIYDNPGCSGQQVPNIVKPGIFDLRDYNFNDKMSSYFCY